MAMTLQLCIDIKANFIPWVGDVYLNTTVKNKPKCKRHTGLGAALPHTVLGHTRRATPGLAITVPSGDTEDQVPEACTKCCDKKTKILSLLLERNRITEETLKLPRGAS